MPNQDHEDLKSGISKELPSVQIIPKKIDHLETAPSGAVQSTKFDSEKVRFALVPKRAYEAVARVFTKGAKKYDVGNWHAGNGFDWDRLQSASERHGNSFALGEDLDPETNEHHLAHRIACDMMLLDHILAGHGTDNRSKTQYLPEKKNASNA